MLFTFKKGQFGSYSDRFGISFYFDGDASHYLYLNLKSIMDVILNK